MTESVWPVNLIGWKAEKVADGAEDEEIGEKMNPESSSPPEMASGGFGKSGWSATVKTEVDGLWWTGVRR